MWPEGGCFQALVHDEGKGLLILRIRIRLGLQNLDPKTRGSYPLTTVNKLQLGLVIL